MAYVLVTGSERKEYEYLKDAIANKSIQGRIYEQDAFGNMRPINVDEAAQIMDNEPKLGDKGKFVDNQEQAEQKPPEFEQKVPVLAVDAKLESIKPAQKIKETDAKKKDSGYWIVKIIVLIILTGLAIFVAVSVVQPFFQELSYWE
jgi:hypothetical protein